MVLRTLFPTKTTEIVLTGLILLLPATACLQPSAEVIPGAAGTGLLRYSVRNSADGQPIPAKLTFIGRGATANPVFTSNEIGFQEPDAIRAHNRVMSISGSGEIPLPAGDYDVYLSRGPEWTISRQQVAIATQQLAVLDTQLSKVIASSGWISGDFHVHSSSSLDSVVPMSNRVVEFIAEGIDLICSTDHNVVSDYAPVIKALGADKLLLSMTGEEITTADWGHYGAFPLPALLTAVGGGAVAVEQRTPVDIFAEVRARSPQAVININHPRLKKAGYFNVGGFDAAAGSAQRPGFSLDFDGVEVLNGFQDPDRATVDQVIEDWFALLDHGHLVTATGNSDTHWLSKNLGGYPRNYLYVGTDDYRKIDGATVAAAIKAHRVFFTTGPFVTLRIGTAGIGDLINATQGAVEVAVKVDAAPWIDVDTVQLLVNGKAVKHWHTPPSGKITRLDSTYSLTLTADSYVVVRVDGDSSLFPVVGDQQDFIVYPFALSNPIFVDVDGNQRFDAPLAQAKH